jgi:hypothetical protein
MHKAGIARTIAEQRLESFLSELSVVRQSDFPYPDSANALKELETFVRRDLDELRELDDDSDPLIVLQASRRSLRHIVTWLPKLGFLLRSTNTRNAFEVHPPLAWIARQLDPEIGLVLSSEWTYHPFVYPPEGPLQRFALIGLPAIESSNALLVPAAGHELGHVVWRQARLASQYSGLLRDAVLKHLFSFASRFATLNRLGSFDPSAPQQSVEALAIWSQYQKWASLQAEELYCDLLGVRLFGIAYIRAFAYLLGGAQGGRSTGYPALKHRMQTILSAAESLGNSPDAYGVPPAEFEELCDADEATSNWSEAEKLGLAAADHAALSITDALLSEIVERTRRAALPVPSPEQATRVAKSFERLAPAHDCLSLADILNGAWMAAQAINQSRPEGRSSRLRILNELVLKTIEVFHIEQRFSPQAKA